MTPDNPPPVAVPMVYVGGGYFREKGVPKGAVAKTMHGKEVEDRLTATEQQLRDANDQLAEFHGRVVALEAELARVKSELANERARDEHSCHADCQRPMCVLRRERDEAVGALKPFLTEEAAWEYDTIRPDEWLHGWVKKDDYRRAAAVVAKVREAVRQYGRCQTHTPFDLCAAMDDLAALLPPEPKE